MNRLLLAAFALLALSGSAAAQQRLRFIDSVLVRTEAPSNVDRPVFRTFGFGGEYTDTIDYRLPVGREREIPAMPPSSFYVLFDSQNMAGWIDRDIRGVPDSITSGAATKFSLRYIFDIQHGEGDSVTFVIPRELAPGIDSINFRDVIGGTGGIVFSRTITNGPDSVVVPNSALTRVAMIVYYDAADITSAVDEPILADARTALRLVPNPAVDRVAIAADLAAGSRVIVSDLRGTTILDERIAERSGRHPLSLDGIAAGFYFVRAIGPDGATIAESRLAVGH